MKLAPKHEIEFRMLLKSIFPSMPIRRRIAISDHHFAEMNNPNRHAHAHAGTEWVKCLVAAHIRHHDTDYDSRVNARVLGYRIPELKAAAREATQPIVTQYINEWLKHPD